MNMRRALFGLVAIPLGLATWVLVLLWLRQLYDWGLPFGAALFWLSHWTFVGWLFAIALMVLWYKLLARRFVSRQAKLGDSQSERHAT
jgi:hypothetical protein